MSERGLYVDVRKGDVFAILLRNGGHSARADWRDDGDLVTLLYHNLVRVIGIIWQVDIVQVDSHECGIQDLGLDAYVLLFQGFKKFTDGQRRQEGLVFFGSKGTCTCKIEHVEVTWRWLRDHDGWWAFKSR